MGIIKKTVSLSIAALLSACGSTPTKPMQAAVLTQSSAATSQLLNQTVSSALNGRKVTLASRAFTQRSEVQVERMTQDPASMPGLNGRLMGVPEVHRFSLKKQGDNCFLVYQKTGQAFPLEGVSCQALSLPIT